MVVFCYEDVFLLFEWNKMFNVGVYVFVGGKVEFYEWLIDIVVCEMAEEIGI